MEQWESLTLEAQKVIMMCGLVMIITWAVLIKVMAAVEEDKEDEILYEDIEK